MGSGGGKGGSSSKNKLPTVNIDTGGLYGTATAGKNNTFNPTDFQSSLVSTTQSAIPDYLNQMINPTYDSEVFKANQTKLANNASTSFENNLMNPLASRGLTRGSNVMAMGNQFSKDLIDKNNDLMTSEDARVSNILNNLLSVYQVPYNQMVGLQGTALGTTQAAAQQNANTQSANSGLWGSIAGATGNGVGSYFGSLSKSLPTALPTG